MKWAEMSRPEVADAAARGSVAIWPIGTTEQHGAHLATGLDLRGAEAVAARAAAQAGVDAVVLPGLPVGASDHWLALGATLSIRPETLVSVLVDGIRSVGRAGFADLILLNGHAGNVGPALAAAGSHSEAALRVEVCSYWQLVDADELARRCVADDGGIGHAGEVETSIALFLDPALVRSTPEAAGYPLHGGPGSRRTAFARTPRPAEEAPGGVYGDPRPANAALGEFVIEAAVAGLAEHCRALTRMRRG